MDQIFYFFTDRIFPVLVALLVFSILVVVHEFGHFILAKKNGVKVEEFAVGMGPILFSKKGKETLYSVRALPLGGFCRMMGEDDGCEDERAFNQKGILARISIIVAGPFMNFIFAFLLIGALLSCYGFYEPVILSLKEGYSAQEAGLEKGDRILSVDGESVLVYQDLQMIMEGMTGEAIEVVVERNGERMAFEVIPKTDPNTGRYILGFVPDAKTALFDSEELPGYSKASVWETAKTSLKTMLFYVRSTVTGFIRIFTFDVPKEEISGPIGIIEVMGDYYEEGMKVSVWEAVGNMASLAALLSANLGALNLFPIPAMDGGRLLFLLIEAVRRKPINPEKEGMIHFAGFVLLMAFMVFIAYNDISRIFFR